MIFRFILLICFAFLLPLTPAGAQGHGGFCEKADSTAATQACLKRHLDSAQRRLKMTYQKLSDQLVSEQKTKLTFLQNSWISYRDAECDWESDQSEDVSIKKLNKTSCLARVTEDRADLLSVLYNDGVVSDEPREYGSFPRWMNVVAKDSPAVAWFYGARRAADINCDGEDDYIMQGVDKSGNIYLSLTQNPTIGRPKHQNFAYMKNGGACFDKITFIPHVKTTPDEGEACQSYVEVKAKDCDGQSIIWAGKKFAVKPEDLLKTKTEEKEK